MRFLVLLLCGLMGLIMLNREIMRTNSKIYMGIDCSSKAIHSVWINSQEHILTQYKWGSKEKDFDTRFLDFGEDFWDDLSKIKVMLDNGSCIRATVEAPIYIQNPKATIAIAAVAGLVRFICFLSGITCEYLDNTKWKRDIIGKGNASKVEIKEYAVNKWGDIFPEQDYADAACIALWNKRRYENG